MNAPPVEAFPNETLYKALRAFLLDLGLDPENLTVESQERFAQKLGRSSRDEAVWRVLQRLIMCALACRVGRAIDAGFYLGAAVTELCRLRAEFRTKRGSNAAYKVAWTAGKVVKYCACLAFPGFESDLDTHWCRPGEAYIPPVAVLRVINL